MEKKVSNAIGDKTARPCEDCRKRRARWYCAADDAFLCQPCDSIVHSVNPLAQHHVRVRLKSSSSSSSPIRIADQGLLPSWNRGFTRKARSVRLHRHAKASKSDGPREPAATALLVPEERSDEIQEENETLLYQVLVFDAEFHGSESTTTTISSPDEEKPSSRVVDLDGMYPNYDSINFTSLFPSDIDFAELAADVESLLGPGLDDDSFCIEGLGLVHSRETKLECFGSRVKKEEEDEPLELATTQGDAQIAIPKNSFNLNSDTPAIGEEDEKKRICLRLNYQAVITAWSGQGVPWMTGDRTQLNPDDCWSDHMEMNGIGTSSFGEARIGVHAANADGGREARVSRYREKRRTRLFSKKIRYEVRKLNAEKRPRIKGRFVKRTTSFSGPGFAF